jgi:hypothetical protein
LGNAISGVERFAMLDGDFEDVEVPRMDQVSAHTDIDERAGARRGWGVHGISSE